MYSVIISGTTSIDQTKILRDIKLPYYLHAISNNIFPFYHNEPLIVINSKSDILLKHIDLIAGIISSNNIVAYYNKWKEPVRLNHSVVLVFTDKLFDYSVPEVERFKNLFDHSFKFDCDSFFDSTGFSSKARDLRVIGYDGFIKHFSTDANRHIDLWRSKNWQITSND